MNIAAVYEVNLYYNGTLIGDVRELAQNLNWSRRRTKKGADSINFTLNDVLFDEWCKARGTSINNILKPYALECRVVRNGVELVGGFLATMPGYEPLGTSANLAMRFDGFLNLLDGVYIRDTSTNLPYGTVSGKAGELVSMFVLMADSIAAGAGKAFGFTTGFIDNLPVIAQTFDNYKTVKKWICDRSDNVTGAGPFDLYFHADKTYDVVGQDNFGDIITNWRAMYPADINYPSATTISAKEISGFASAVLGIGAGEISADVDENTALIEFISDPVKVAEYGYSENLYQESSISTPSVLNNNMLTRLDVRGNPVWQPEITLHGVQVEPTPNGNVKIWLGDIITIENNADKTGMTNGQFRVDALEVNVSSAGDETITPTLERVN